MSDEISVSVEEAARRIGVSEATFWRMIADQKVRTFTVGRRRLIAVTELERFVDREHRTQNMRPIPPQRKVAR
jgi:excisionase family DNA binding protein